MLFSCPPSLLFFSAKEQACGPDARALRGKSIGGKRIPAGDPILFPQREAGLSGATEFGMRNVEFGILLFFLIIPHSAFYIPHLGCSPGPRNVRRLMVFSRNALASGPGNA
jgi:hypothetical protein